jgi:hypothetical protein
MPGVRRTPINRPVQQRITPRAVELFTYLRKCERAGVSPDDPDYIDADWALHAELRLPPWAPCITWVDEHDMRRKERSLTDILREPFREPDTLGLLSKAFVGVTIFNGDR